MGWGHVPGTAVSHWAREQGFREGICEYSPGAELLLLSSAAMLHMSKHQEEKFTVMQKRCQKTAIPDLERNSTTLKSQKCLHKRIIVYLFLSLQTHLGNGENACKHVKVTPFGMPSQSNCECSSVCTSEDKCITEGQVCGTEAQDFRCIVTYKKKEQDCIPLNGTSATQCYTGNGIFVSNMPGCFNENIIICKTALDIEFTGCKINPTSISESRSPTENPPSSRVGGENPGLIPASVAVLALVLFVIGAAMVAKRHLKKEDNSSVTLL
ncbi:uncharacterized protein LOC108930300 isoform X1 [Scleropages formosus]|uniref:uncharacterized protein LOC108930300 isoform X1 n=1 Tax=Scleropages formosus TaxID=113540 RepID=UPI0010FA72CF|nr:uncharacterized protein LOC108930300 isoform X1 [Scleropages formosus]